MKKYLVLLLLVPLVMMLAAGCGPSAEQVLKDSMKASEDIDTVHFKVEAKTELPRAPIQDGKVAKNVFVQESEGDIDFRTGNMRIKTELTEGVPVTMLKVEDKQYWQLAGNWYEVPEDVQTPAPVSQALSVSQYIKYFEQVKKLGDTRVDGEACYHIQATPDMEELVKLPGVTDLLKNPEGQQIRTIDELEELKAVFDFYILKDNDYFKSSQEKLEYRATDDFIKLGYAEPGDMIKGEETVILSDFNKNLNLKAPEKVSPLPVPQE